jgi:hypothetical protein
VESVLSSSTCLGAGMFVWIAATIPMLFVMSSVVASAARILRPSQKKVI